MPREMPRWRGRQVRENTGDLIEVVPQIPSVDPEVLGEFPAFLAALAAIALLVLVLIPLLLFGIELLILALLIAAGAIARAALGRPWVVYAAPAGENPATRAWEVRGWRRSEEAVDELAAQIAAGSEPDARRLTASEA
jgi:hypothetical protein